MGKNGSGQSFAEYLNEAPLAPDTTPKLVLTGEVKRSAKEGVFVLKSPELGTVELEVQSVLEFEPLDGGLTAITVDATRVRSRFATAAGTSGGRGLVPFVLATPHHAALASVRDQFLKGEATEPILDVETAFIKDVWTDPGLVTSPVQDAFNQFLPASPFGF